MPNEPTDHAVARGRDVSLRYEGGHSQENHTVVLEWCRSGVGDHRRTAAATNVSDQSSQSAERVFVGCTTEEPEHQPRANDHEGRNAEKWCWRCRRGIQEDVTCHKVSLERIRDRATAKEPVVREKYRRSHRQGASGENPRLNHSRRASGEKKEQHGYEDSEKNIEATMRSQSSAQRREGKK